MYNKLNYIGVLSTNKYEYQKLVFRTLFQILKVNII